MALSCDVTVCVGGPCTDDGPTSLSDSAETGSSGVEEAVEYVSV